MKWLFLAVLVPASAFCHITEKEAKIVHDMREYALEQNRMMTESATALNEARAVNDTLQQSMALAKQQADNNRIALDSVDGAIQTMAGENSKLHDQVRDANEAKLKAQRNFGFAVSAIVMLVVACAIEFFIILKS